MAFGGRLSRFSFSVGVIFSICCGFAKRRFFHDVFVHMFSCMLSVLRFFVHLPKRDAADPAMRAPTSLEPPEGWFRHVWPKAAAQVADFDGDQTN